MHLVGYLYEDHHDARSLERKVRENIFTRICAAVSDENKQFAINCT
jgi:hypothetical protein